MLYFPHMNQKSQGYEMTEEDINSALRYLIYEKKHKDATREDAIKYLEEKHALAHMAAHKLVEDEQSGKISKVEIKSSKKN